MRFFFFFSLPVQAIKQKKATIPPNSSFGVLVADLADWLRRRNALNCRIDNNIFLTQNKKSPERSECSISVSPKAQTQRGLLEIATRNNVALLLHGN